MTQPQAAVRDTLFGDLPFEMWANPNISEEPWTSFLFAKAALDQGDQQSCINTLTDIVNRSGLESRHYLQAWYFLRQLGVLPPAGKEKELYGVIVEVGLNNGVDIIAAYADHHARYYNYSGAAVIWERQDGSLDDSIQKLLSNGREVVAKIGPWDKPRPSAPPTGQARINMLAPGGLYFGQAPLKALSSDLLGGPVIAAAIDLMKALIKKTKP